MSVGKALPHESAAAHVQGTARYTDDQARFAGMLSAWPVLAPHAHARITALETAPALEIPGVVYVLTYADVPGANDVSAHKGDEPLLPEHEVMFHAQAVAWVLG